MFIIRKNQKLLCSEISEISETCENASLKTENEMVAHQGLFFVLQDLLSLVQYSGVARTFYLVGHTLVVYVARQNIFGF